MNRSITLCCFLFFATFVTQDAPALEQRRALPPPQTASSPTPSGSAGGAASQAANAMPNARPKRITAYTLSPELYRKAKTLGRIRFSFRLFSFSYGVFVLWFILERRVSAKFRDWAESASHKRYVQVVIYVPLLIVSIALLELPLDLFSEILFKRYGISIESWGSWTGDWLKIQSLTILAATLLTLLLYAIIRRSPQRWWFYFWLIALPIFLFFFFLQPYVIDPMFNEFQPLSAKAPAIVPELQRIARRAGMEISPERMFWMKASDKTIYCNAYVTGFGASKRIVIWDTCFAAETTDGILTIFGHELGHYALGHIWKGLIFFSLLAFVLLYLGRRSIGWLLSKYGESWSIRNLDDWASLPALLLLITLYGFAATVAANTFSRYMENQADVYGLEVTHGILADPGQASAISFQKYGESVFVDPDPSAAYVFLFFDHPTVTDRVHLFVTYDPWSKGEPAQFVK
jgi:STE24 endopeptidase